ncbi:MAG: DUF2510 domain-containing protein [Salinibacterium sp.]|nr:DUF2510 domain-containing protein [Salinibacterium sp.]
MSTPAGWYPDPAGGPNTRWWDGTQWTDRLNTPYSTAPALTAPAGTKVYNVWIWLVIFAPYLTLPFLFTIDFSSYFNLDFTDPSASTNAQLQMMSSPAFVLLSLGGWVTAAAAVLFSWLDWRWLTAAGVPKPFHWAFGFISLAGYPVYAIGRAVVTRRRTGQGIAVLWVTIAALVLSFIIAVVWVVTLFGSMMSQFTFS